jgi:hypothetical protein
MLVGQPWSVCITNKSNAATSTSRTVATLVGGQHVGGRPMAARAALVVAAGRADWLVWNGERMLIPPTQQAAILTALNFVQVAVQVPPPWLNAFFQGPDFAPPQVNGFGTRVARGPAGGPAQIGQVFVTSTGRRHYYVLNKQGLTPVTDTEANLLDAVPGQVAQGKVTTAMAADHVGSESSDGMPSTMPVLANKNISHGKPLCVVYSGPSSAAQVTVGGRVPADGLATTGGNSVNQIVMPPGSAALVGEVIAPPSPSSAASPALTGQCPDVTSYFLVTDGVRYGLASPEVARCSATT